MSEVKNVKIEDFSVKELRERCFVMRSTKMNPKAKYTYLDDAADQIEALPNFENWETFSETWDVLWVGLDPRTLKWELGRHLSPMRKIVSPVRIVPLDERTKRMMMTAEDRKDIVKIEIPFKEPIPETEEDRIISESLSGRVIVDEPDEDKAMRMIEKNMKMLADQMAILKAKK